MVGCEQFMKALKTCMSYLSQWHSYLRIQPTVFGRLDR